MKYYEKLNDSRWQKKRLKVMERDGFKCVECGRSADAGGDSFHVHHCFYEKGDPWDTGNEFLLTLCSKCHKKRHAAEDAIKRSLGIIFAKLRLDDSLECLANEFVSAAKAETPCYTFVDGMVWEWATDDRWFLYARENPAARQAYEALVRKPKWPEPSGKKAKK